MSEEFVAALLRLQALQRIYIRPYIRIEVAVKYDSYYEYYADVDVLCGYIDAESKFYSACNRVHFSTYRLTDEEEYNKGIDQLENRLKELVNEE